MPLFTRFLALLLLITLFITPLAATHAQLGDVVMQPRDVRLLFLPSDGSQVLVRMPANAGDTLWLMVNSTPDLVFNAVFLNLRGETIEAERTQQDTTTYLKLVTVEAGDHFLQLQALDESAGYLRLAYDLVQPTPLAPSENATPFNEPSFVQFKDLFDDNANSWWEGLTEGGQTVIADGLMTMTLAQGGQLFGGFTSVPGSEQSNYLLMADIAISGDTNDALFGLMFHVLDAANYYLFQILPELGQWRFLILEEGVWTVSFGWNVDPRLLGAEGAHSLAVWVLGENFLFLWDGAILGHVRDSVHVGGGIGVFAEVATDGLGTPTYQWDNVRLAIPVEGQAWGQPTLPEAATLTPTIGITYSSGGASSLQNDLIGQWAWNDENNTQTMLLTFMADGNYTQLVSSTSGTTTPQGQQGRWYVEDNVTLVLEVEGLPEQRYQPYLDSTNLLLTIPELGNRIFVRLEAESQE